MPPRTWFYLILLLVVFLTACQPIRPIEVTPTNAPMAAVPSTSTTGQTDCPIVTDQPLDLIIKPSWEEGESHRYQAKFSRSPVQNGEKQRTITTSYPMSVTVLEASAGGYVLEWRHTAMLSTPVKVRIEYATNPYGEITFIHNYEELYNLIEPQTILQRDEPDNALSPPSIDSLVNDPDTVMAQLTRDVEIYHAIYGLYFTYATPYTIEVPVTLPPTSLSGTNITQISPLRYDAAKGCFQLHWQSNFVIDPNSVAKRDSLWSEIEKAYLSSSPTLQTDVFFDLDLNTSWLNRVELQLTSLSEGDGRIEKLTLTYVPPVE